MNRKVSKSKDKQVDKVDSVWSVKIGSKTTLLVKKGDRVKKGQPIFSKTKKEYEKINASAALSCQPKKIAPLVSLQEGREISKGDCLVSVGKFLNKKKLISPVSGVFGGFDQQTGEIKIVIKTEKEEIFSPVKGEVVEASKERLRIKFAAYRIFGEKAGKGKSWGKLTSFDKVFQEETDKITFAKKLTITDIEKSIVLGSRGFLSFGFPESFEKLSIPGLIIKEEKEILEKLDSLSGSSALLDSDAGQLLICID